MELLGWCGDWLDTDTVTAQGFTLRLDTTSEGGDLYLATSGDLSLAASGDFSMATDTLDLPETWHRSSDGSQCTPGMGHCVRSEHGDAFAQASVYEMAARQLFVQGSQRGFRVDN